MVTKSVRNENPPADTVTGDGAGADHVENLAALAGEAQKVDQGGEAGEAAQAGGTIKVDTHATPEDVRDLLAMVREMADPALVEMQILKDGQVKAIWSDDVLLRIAKPLVQIMDRYDMGISEAFEKWGPYVLLLAGIAGPAFATFKAVRLNAAEAASASQQQQ